MAPLDVYIESNDFGGCIAHLLALPGCFSRGHDEGSALATLPQSVRRYVTDHSRHGLNPSLPSPLSFHVAERIHVGDQVRDQTGTMAFFSPEKEPISVAEVDDLLQLAANNRADLLALLQPFAEENRTAGSPAGLHVVEQVARHVGSADRWYSTRIVDPQTLPADWEEIAQKPLLTFLQIERQRVEVRLRNLDDAQRARVYTPRHLARNPSEQWTVRKVLRRILMHERDHVQQIRTLLKTL